MSSLLKAKRELEALVGPIMFDVLRYSPPVVHVYNEGHHDLIGIGDTHLDAIADARKTLRERDQIETNGWADERW